MPSQDVRSIVLDALTRVLSALGITSPMLDDNVIPLRDWEKFDSQVAEDATAQILATLGASLEHQSPFTKKRGDRFPNLGEIISAFGNMVTSR